MSEIAKHTVFILGDSTSMTIGCERHMYPFIIADSACWPESTEIINSSQPGFTSADACAFFFRHRKEYQSLNAVIIHLGTCDATSWEIHKGKYNFLSKTRDILMKAAGKRKERTRLKNRLLHFEWNGTFDPDIELPESPEDYEFNLTRIIEACLKSSVAVIMIRPKANAMFPPGVGKGNFVFYRYLELKDKISHKLSIPDKRFLEALKLQEKGDHTAAANTYRDILLESGSLSSHYEYPLLVTNNYAVCIAEQGNFEEAESLFILLLKEKGVRREIILFNLANVYGMKGNYELYRQYLHESYESDQSMYRIRSPYLDAIDRITEHFGNGVHVFDLATFIDDSLFVDHTHPLREGQEMIANKIIDCLKSCGIAGSNIALINNKLFNPELALGNTTEFFTYYRTYEPFKVNEIYEYIDKIKKRFNLNDYKSDEKIILEGLPKELKTALEYHLMHPCFPSLRFLLHNGPQYPSDVGRFPEFFICRYLIPYLNLFEKDSAFGGLFSSANGVLRHSYELLAILPTEVAPLVSLEHPFIDTAVESLRLPAILLACRQAILAHLRRGNQIYERMKTTIFWYFRETLRYGSHSRISMRYDRTILEYTAEALVVAYILNSRLEQSWGDEIKELARLLEEIVSIHEHYCQKFSTINQSEDILKEYNQRLFETADKLEIKK